MMGWNTPITDRSKKDFQNSGDYTRVEENTEYLLNRVKALGYISDAIQSNKTDWSENDIDSLQQHLRIINNLAQIEFIELPGLKVLRTDLDINPPTSEDYNDWEHNLSVIHSYAESSLAGIHKLSFKLGGGKIAT